MLRAFAIGVVNLLFLIAYGGASTGPIFSDDFEHGLAGWQIYGEGSAQIVQSNDAAHGHVLLLHPVGDAYALVKGTARTTGVRLEGEVLFPTEMDNYLGVVYNFRRTKRRLDFGLIYIKGNDSYLSVNPHRDFNVGRTLYGEYQTPLKGAAAIRTGQWQKFKVEVVGKTCHFYVGDMNVPQLTFSDLELESGAVGLQPRSVGGDVWVDNVRVTPIDKLSYQGRIPDIQYKPETLLTDWKVSGPYEQTEDQIAADGSHANWKPFATDRRGAVITAQVVDYHGPKTVAYFRTEVESATDRDAYLDFSTVDELAMWLNGRFWWFIPRGSGVWYDFASNEKHKGQRIPVSLRAGKNEIILRVRGGSYASGGFMLRVVQQSSRGE